VIIEFFAVSLPKFLRLNRDITDFYYFRAKIVFLGEKRVKT